jgi:hypothetical protein
VYDCFGPFERMGFRIMGLNKAINGLTQLPHRSELAPRRALRLRILNQHSTWFNQLARVGV